ncbi:MAG: hypothetical protein JSW63_12995 [Ignavibacterium sp.]|nr:MAG: hypothetical protein JSW63_12995 [Ignavibacterium sp.]
MEAVINSSITNKTKIILYDFIALSVIYLTPTLSHILNFPVYYLDPMRLMLFFVIIHTNKKNSYVIAATLPLVSFIFSSHPVLIKSLTMSAELLLNVWLYYEFSKLFSNKFIPAALSILVSKVAYYAVKYLLVSAALLSTEIISTPLHFQIAVLIIIGVYAFFMIPRNNKLNS